MKTVKTLPFILSFALVGCNHSPSPATQNVQQLATELLQWVPDGTSLASTRQAMEQHQFVCSVAAYDDLNAVTNNSNAARWVKEFTQNQAAESITNISVLDCDNSNGRHAQWLIINDKTYKLLQWGVSAGK